MKSITFHCETITPMFLAGADGKTPELRPPSIKGALRFWWRALNGHLVEQKEDGTWDYSELKKKEAEIFGGAYIKEIEERVNLRSKVSIDVEPHKLFDSNNKLNGKTFKVKGHNIDILDYLAYGTNSYKKGIGTTFDRKYIKSGQKFIVKIFYNENVNIDNDIIYPFIAMSRIGGLGSKTRNGFGKFYIDKIEDKRNNKIILPHITDILKKEGLPKPYLNFSKSIRIFQLKQSFGKAIEVHSQLGLIYKFSIGLLEKKHQYYKRSYLASPLQVDKVNKGLLERHAKSYFLSVAKSGDKKYKGYIYFIPYLFLGGFDDIIDFKKYKKIMNNNHEDFLTDNKEQVTEEWFQEKYNEIHNEFNNILSQKMKEIS